MEVSSTTTTSWGSRLSRSWRNRVRLPGLEPEQPVQRRAPQRRQAVTDRRVDGHGGRLVADGLFEPGRRLAGRCGEGDQRWPAPCRGRLRVAAAPGPGPRWWSSRCRGHRRSPTRVAGRRSRRPGAGSPGRRLASKSCREPRRQHGVVDAADRPGARSSRSEATWRSSAQRRSRYRVVPSRWSGRSSPTQRAPRHGGEPLRRIGPGQRAEVAPASCRRWPCRGWSRGRRRRGPSRGARAAKAAPSRASSSVAAPSRASRSATWTSEVERIPASLKARSSPDAPQRHRGVEDVRHLHGRHEVPPRSKSSLSDSTSASRRAPRPHAAGLVRVADGLDGAHAAHEEVEDAAEVALGVVAAAAASAGSGAAPPSRATPAADSAPPPSPRAAPRAGSATP